MTMHQFGALLRHHRDVRLKEIQREDYRFGIVASILWNANRDPEKTEPRYPQDFFASLKDLKKPRTRKQSAEEMFSVLQSAAKRGPRA